METAAAASRLRRKCLIRSYEFQGVFCIKIARVSFQRSQEVLGSFQLISGAVQAPTAPQQRLFRIWRDLQGIFRQLEQVFGAVGIEIGKEGTKLVAQHALRQTVQASLIIGLSGFSVAVKINHVRTKVKPGERIALVFFGLKAGSFKGQTAVGVFIPIFTQNRSDGLFLLGAVSE